MSLLERIRDAQTCKVAWCDQPRLEGAEFCGSAGRGHLTEFWQHRLRKQPDGTYIVIVGPNARLAAKDMTAALA